MKIIKKPWDRVIKLWAKPRDMEVPFRLIRYVIREKVDEGELFHHTLTGALILLDQQEIAAIDRLPGQIEDVLKPLIDEHFIVPVDFNEDEVLNQLRTVLRLTEKKGFIAGYTILPTTYCNARCFYCYENNVEHKHMTIETSDEIVQFIKNHRADKKISINWFGGEPLVGWKIIDHISEKLKNENIPFEANMITNGYLFDKDMVIRAKEIWNLKEVQITLDGTHEVYNRVKSYVSVKDDPYFRVLDNIAELLDAEIYVTIRLNMDKHNHENLGQLVDELSERFHGRSRFSVYCAVLFDDTGFEPISRTTEDNLMLLRWKRDIENKMNDKALPGRNKKLPQIIYNYCMADGDYTAIINPDGTLGKCEHHIDENLGNLKDGWTDLQAIKEYKTPRILEKCLDCALQPSCYHLKNCESDSDCTEYYYEDLMNSARLAMCETYKYHNQVSENDAEDSVPDTMVSEC